MIWHPRPAPEWWLHHHHCEYVEMLELIIISSPSIRIRDVCVLFQTHTTLWYHLDQLQLVSHPQFGLKEACCQIWLEFPVQSKIIWYTSPSVTCWIRDNSNSRNNHPSPFPFFLNYKTKFTAFLLFSFFFFLSFRYWLHWMNTVIHLISLSLEYPASHNVCRPHCVQSH